MPFSIVFFMVSCLSGGCALGDSFGEQLCHGDPCWLHTHTVTVHGRDKTDRANVNGSPPQAGPWKAGCFL